MVSPAMRPPPEFQSDLRLFSMMFDMSGYRTHYGCWSDLVAGMNASQNKTFRSDTKHEKAGVETQTSSADDLVDVVVHPIHRVE